MTAAARQRAQRPAHRCAGPGRLGDADTAFESSLAEASARLCANAVVRHLPAATHWLHHEEVDEVNRLLTTFLDEAESLR